MESLGSIVQALICIAPMQQKTIVASVTALQGFHSNGLFPDERNVHVFYRPQQSVQTCREVADPSSKIEF